MTDRSAFIVRLPKLELHIQLEEAVRQFPSLPPDG